jgi:dihydrofolate reductase
MSLQGSSRRSGQEDDMGAIVVHEFISLDGVADNPAWTFEFGFDPAMGATLAEIMTEAKAILLGRTTYEMFAPVWSARSADDDPGAPFFNDTDKFVVSSTLTTVDWVNTTLLGGYDRSLLQRLKEKVDGTIYVSGSLTLVRALLADGLVDRLHLFVYPVALGGGQRLFPDGTPKINLRLTASQAYGNGVVYLSYVPQIEAGTGT